MNMRLEQDTPGLRLAFEFVRPSYDWAITRWDAVHSRIVGLLTVATTLMAVSPLFAAATALEGRINLASWWFRGAAAAYCLLLLAAVIGLLWGTMMVMTPKVLYDHYLDCNEEEFRREVLSYAGDHFELNINTVGRKAKCEAAMVALLGGQLFFLIMWIARG